jgi:hypothetical protein
MTLLQISEKIRDHLIKQKAKSESNSGACKYRNVNGDMCAVGCLIPDSVYNPNLESKAMEREEIINAVGLSLKMKLDANTIALLKAWQNYHDIAYTQFVAVDNALRVSYDRWLVEGAMPDSPHSPSAMHEHLKTIEQYDMTGEITKRHISQVSGYIADHLLKQGRQAVDKNGACQYRSDNGCMCAVGVLIDPEKYVPDLEGVSLSSTAVRVAVANSLGLDVSEIYFDTPMYEMMRAWQRYHDNRESNFSKEQIYYKSREIMLLLDNKHKFPDLKD